jgi:peptidoglycan/LPS O-acetylase OafA/YrhL
VQRASHAVATYSYGIYLAHVPIMWLAFQQLADRAWPVQALTFLTLIVAVPPMLYHGIEAPLIRVGARLADGFAARRNVTTVLAQ